MHLDGSCLAYFTRTSLDYFPNNEFIHAHLSPPGVVLVIESILHVQHQPTSVDSHQSQRTLLFRGLVSAAPLRFDFIARRIIQFKNKFCPLPYLPFHLLDESEKSLIKMYSSPLQFCRWPTALPESQDSRQSPNKHISLETPISLDSTPHYTLRCPNVLTVQTVDRLAQLTLDSHLYSFRVTFPALVDVLDGASQPSVTPICKKYSYLPITQSYSIYDYPDWCKPALDLLLQRPDNDSKHQSGLSDFRKYTPVQFPTAAPGSISLSATLNSQFLPCADTTQTKHADSAVVLQTKEATFRVFPTLSSTRGDSNFRVFVVWEDDGTLFLTDDQLEFMYMLDYESACESQTFVINSPPPVARHPVSKQVYPLQSIISTCIDLYYNMLKFDCPVQDVNHVNPLKSENSLKLSSVVHETVSVPHLGMFTSYLDGRVSVLFVDRSMLEMRYNPANSTGICKILSSDGETVIVRLERPLGYINYIRPAMEFFKWTYSDHQTRNALQSKRTEINSIVDTMRQRSNQFTSRLQAISDKSSSKTGTAQQTYHRMITDTQQRIKLYLSN
ncbi:hypothetical protein BDV3_001024 [Batrachochytrium dendrobatidis]